MTLFRQQWRGLRPWLRWTLITFFYLALIGWFLAWQYQRPGGASLYGHNHTDRPIFSYWVNDGWGGNGGVTCCWRITGDTLKLVWIVSRTKAQAEQGIEEERHELEVLSPARQRGDRYLHVHFFPENQVKLAWSPDHDTPYEQLTGASYQPAKGSVVAGEDKLTLSKTLGTEIKEIQK